LAAWSSDTVCSGNAIAKFPRPRNTLYLLFDPALPPIVPVAANWDNAA
jgi:hypothetical protein